MTDKERIDKLEQFIKTIDGNGIAIMPLNNCTKFSIDNLGDEDGSDLGDELATGKTLREVIDRLLGDRNG